MLFDSPTNQQFPILTREQAAALGETVEALHDIDGGVTLILEVVE